MTVTPLNKPPQPPPAWLFRQFPHRVHFLDKSAPAPRPRYNWRMDNATSNAFSSAGLLADIFRLIPRSKRAAFCEMLVYELRGCVLSDQELRRVAERAWHRFLKHGWPT